MKNIIYLSFLFIILSCTANEDAKKKIITYSPKEPFNTALSDSNIQKKTILDTPSKQGSTKILVDGYDRAGRNPKIVETQKEPYPLDSIEVNEIYTPSKYIVREGESLFQIVKKFHVTFDAVIQLNQLEKPYELYVGQALILPQASRHKVEPNQTISDIAKIHSVFVSDIIRANNLKNNNTLLRPGTEIVIPAKYASNLSGYYTKPKDRHIFEQSEEELANSLKNKELENDDQARKSSDIRFLPPTPTLDSDKFLLPNQGRWIGQFGSLNEGIKMQGVVISNSLNSEVLASQNGVVVYSDNALKSYGNMIIIKHDLNYTSAYGHLARSLVKRGDIVKKGQVIGNLGMTGETNRPQLYFEIRKNTKTINPLLVLAR